MAKQKEISLKAYGKINLGLDVLGTLPNGYHEVRMIMQSVGIHDTVSVRYTTVPGITVLTDSGSIPCDEHNLAYGNARLAHERTFFRNRSMEARQENLC